MSLLNDPVALISILISILLAISLHEMMHAWVGYILGDTTAKHHGRITLNPLAHVDPFMSIIVPAALAIIGGPIIGAAKPVPFNPYNLRFKEYGMAMVALAGPLTNLVLAGLGTLGYHLLGGVLQEFSAWFVIVNVGFFVLNILPIPPLDGSRVLYVFAPDNVRNVMDQIERMGIIVIILVLFLLLSVPFFADFLGGFRNFFIEDIFRIR